MDGLPLMAEVIEGRWRPAIGDPTVVGWVTVLAYLLASAACVRAAWREPMTGGRRRSKPSGFWLMLSAALFLLGINKQIDLQTLFTLMARRVLMANGLYQNRRHYQTIFLGAIAASSVLLLIGSLWIARRSLRHRWAALVGMAFVMGFVVIRAASFHHVRRTPGLATGRPEMELDPGTRRDHRGRRRRDRGPPGPGSVPGPAIGREGPPELPLSRPLMIRPW